MAKKKSSTAITGILIGGAALALVVYFVADYNFFLDFVIAGRFQPSAQMGGLIDDIELTSSGERILKASLPVLQSAEDFNKNCGNIEEDSASLGCLADGKIYVYDIQNEELEGIKQTVLAHELLHAVWQRERKSSRADLENMLQEVYATHRDELADHMAHYSEADMIDELHSVIGTQLNYSEMPDELADHYNKFFKNQAKIVGYYNAYNGRFTEIQNRMTELSEKIQKMRDEIDAETKEYNREYAQLNSDISDFNYRANNMRGAATMDEYNELNLRRDELSARYDALAAKIEEVNKLINEYNSDYAHAGTLYESIDSNSSKNINTIEE